jgi:hypothetical protein
MVSQKRRRFQIRQRQKRRARLLKSTSAFKTITPEYNKVWILLRNIVERKKPPTETEIKFIQDTVTRLDPKANLLLSQSIGVEKRVGKHRLTIERHTLNGLLECIPYWAERIKAETGDDRLYNWVRLKVKATKPPTP